MSKVIKIKKGLDIPLTGEASARITQDTVTKTFGLVPDDFPGYKWKSAVKEGDTVKAGDPLFYAKEDENLRIVSRTQGRCLVARRHPDVAEAVRSVRNVAPASFRHGAVHASGSPRHIRHGIRFRASCIFHVGQYRPEYAGEGSDHPG